MAEMRRSSLERLRDEQLGAVIEDLKKTMPEEISRIALLCPEGMTTLLAGVTRALNDHPDVATVAGMIAFCAALLYATVYIF